MPSRASAFKRACEKGVARLTGLAVAGRVVASARKKKATALRGTTAFRGPVRFTALEDRCAPVVRESSFGRSLTPPSGTRSLEGAAELSAQVADAAPKGLARLALRTLTQLPRNRRSRRVADYLQQAGAGAAQVGFGAGTAHFGAGAAQVGLGAGTQHLGAGAAQVGFGTQHFARSTQHFAAPHRLIFGRRIFGKHSFGRRSFGRQHTCCSQGCGQGFAGTHCLGAGAAQVGFGAGTQHLGAGAAHVGFGAQQSSCFMKSNRPALAGLAAMPTNINAAVSDIHFIPDFSSLWVSKVASQIGVT